LKFTTLAAAAIVAASTIAPSSASAEHLTAATLTADCNGYTIDVSAYVSWSYQGAVEYTLHLDPALPSGVVAGSFPFTGNGVVTAELTETITVPWPTPPTGTVQITGDVTMVNATSVSITTFNDGNPITLSCGGPPPPGGTAGCTPGFWKQRHHTHHWRDYEPADPFDAVFGVAGHGTLMDALRSGGGHAIALARHAAAALLNAAHADVDYAFTVADVITMVQGAMASGDYEATKDVFATENERGCPLSGRRR